ncbi:MAG: hypothetical protein AAF196_20370 [Planctomycetota bacterium]
MNSSQKAHGQSSTSGLGSVVLSLGALAALALVLAFGGVFDGDPSSGPQAPVSSPEATQADSGTPDAITVADGAPRDGEELGSRTESEVPEAVVGHEHAQTESTVPVFGGRPAVALRGRVVDSDGQPIPEARLQAVRPPGSEAAGMISIDVGALVGAEEFDHEADEEGYFDIPFDSGREFLIVARTDDRPIGQVEGVVPEGAEFVDGLEVVLEVGGTIHGFVVGIEEDFVPQVEDEQIRVIARRADSGGVSVLGFLEMNIGGLDPRACEKNTPLEERGERGWPFQLRGLRLGQDYEICCVRSWTGEARRSSAVVAVRSGATGVELRFDPGTRLVAEVRDSQTGEPIEGARFAVGESFGMKILGQELPQQVARPLDQESDIDGRLVAGVETDPEHPSRSVQVQRDGYFTESLGEQVFRGQAQLDLGVVRLRPAPMVVVHVVDGRTGEPIANADVELKEFVDFSEQMDSFRVDTTFEMNRANQQRTKRWMQSGGPRNHREETDDEGNCELSWDFPVAAELTVQANGYAVWQQLDMQPPVGSETIEIIARLGEGGRIVVTVLDTEGRPVAGASVLRMRGQTWMPSPDSEETQGPTGADGQLTFSGLTEGKHRFTLAEEGSGGPQMMQVMMSAMMQADGGVPPGFVEATAIEGATTEVELREPKRATVRGFVTLGGEPLENASVSLLNGSGTGSAEVEAVEEVMQAMQGGLFGKLMGAKEGSQSTTSYDGGYELLEVPHGSHRVQIDHRDLAMPCVLPIDVFGEVTNLDLAVPAAILTGRVVDDQGNPVESVQVAVTTDVGFDASDLPGADSTLGAMMGMRDRSVQTDADGRFELRGVRSARALKLRIRGSYQVSRSIDIQPLGAEESRDLGRVDLERAGRVLVRAGEGANFGQVRAVWLGEGELEARSLGMIQSGSALLRGLRPGNYRIELVEGDGDERSTEVSVRAGETARVQL